MKDVRDPSSPEKNRSARYQYLLSALLVLSTAPVWHSCEGAEKPLDADTRHLIDSLSSAKIGYARVEMDSACSQARRTQLPLLIDSIKQVRLRKIEEQLKNIPK